MDGPTLRRLPVRPAAITALQFGFLAAVELAAGRPGKAVALVGTFAVLQVPRLLRPSSRESP